MIEAVTRLAQSALQNWSIEVAELKLLKFRENGVFKVVNTDGQKYVCRVHRPGYHSTQAIDSELQWLAALAHDRLDVPKVIPTKDGRLWVTGSANGVPEPRVVDLFEWVPGQTLSGMVQAQIRDFDPTGIAEAFGQVGEIMAQLHNQASVWQAPAGFTRHAWDADGLVGERPFWNRFWELDALTNAQKDILLEVRDRLKQDLNAYGKTAENYGLIHADLNMDNVMIDNGRVRPIDFDDCGFGWYLFDVATTLNYVIDQPAFELTSVPAFFDGYRKHRPLPESEMVHLPMMLTARRLTYIGWVITRQEITEIRKRTPVLVEKGVRSAAEYLAS